MSDRKPAAPTEDLVLEYELDAPPEKVWRAISIPAFREKWLPTDALADAEPISSASGEEVRYRMRDDEPPYLESVVTFQVRPNALGGAKLRIIHEPADALGVRQRTPANGNAPRLMRAA
jgi:uncharacterized protein YndB with AHSA1/START domain